MKRFFLKAGIMFTVLPVLFAAVGGFSLMYLWNWLMPAIFGLSVLTFWQALGLLVLSRMLFGLFRGRSHFGHHHYKMKYARMQNTNGNMHNCYGYKDCYSSKTKQSTTSVPE
jgi:hypothetical protein